MIPSRKVHPMRKLSLAAFLCVSLAASSSALADRWYTEHDIVFSVEGWPKMATRADGKLKADYFGFATQAPQAASTGRATVQVYLGVPLGDPGTLFMKHALEGRVLKTILVEAFVKGEKPPPRAPFAVRLSDVRASDVSFAMGGRTHVTLQASKIEVFTANQTATGTMQPSQQFGWDVRAGKGM